MEGAGQLALRRGRARAAARRRDASLETRLAHPIFDPVRPWLERLEAAGGPTLANLNRLAEQAGIRTASGRAVRFVPPSPSDPYYEVRLFQSGCVPTRPENRHDFFNALAWLAFPLTKARINALHAAQIPREKGKRGRLRDLLTLLDEGGAIVQCDDGGLISLIRRFRWKELFWDERARVLRSLKIHVIGHAVLEKALEPWPGIACKALFVDSSGNPDAHAAAWLRTLHAESSPRTLAPLPVFGYPGWLPASANAQFYDDKRYFRPFRRTVKLPPGVGQAAAVQNTEESPGSAERDAG